jgi:hypothetical protein
MTKTPEFEHQRHREAHERVAEYLDELFEDALEDQGHFYVRYGSTVLEIAIEPYGPDEASVIIMSYCVQGAEVDEDLRTGLLELNHDLPFGAFSIVGKDIFFSHALFGRTLQRTNLLGAIAAVAETSDRYDDLIADKYGGERALDRIQDTGGRKERQKATS